MRVRFEPHPSINEEHLIITTGSRGMWYPASKEQEGLGKGGEGKER